MIDISLCLDAGSPSIKIQFSAAHLWPGRQLLICNGECQGIGHHVRCTAKDGAGASQVDECLPEGTTHEDALAALRRWSSRNIQGHLLFAAGHRVVHGG